MFFEFEKCVMRKEHVQKVCSCSGRQYAEGMTIPGVPRQYGDLDLGPDLVPDLDLGPGSIDPRPGSLAPAKLLNLKNYKIL